MKGGAQRTRRKEVRVENKWPGSKGGQEEEE